MNVVLIDDEILALKFLERQLMKIDGINVIAKFRNPLEGKKYLLKHDTDLLFLDINMPEVSGLALAKEIRKSKPSQRIVFVTAYDEYAVTAFELNVEDYIVKPVRFKRLETVVNRIKRSAPEEKDHKLHINVSEQLLVGTDEQTMQPLTWRTSKVQELFLYLLQQENKVVSKAFLAELLWPNSNSERSLSQLYTSIYHAKNSIKDYTDYLEIKSSLEGYILVTKNVIINIKEWERKLGNLSNISLQTIDTYEQVMALNSSPYLHLYDYIWAEPLRYKYEEKWLYVALKIAKYYFSKEEFDQAIHWYKQILNRHSTNEEAHFSLMKLYARTEKNYKVAKQYYLLKTTLKKELDVRPNSKISNWYMEWERPVTNEGQ